jgi:hypothetical protein
MHGYTVLRGMGALGDGVDPDTVSTLVSAGYDQGQINQLMAMGATDTQLQNLPYGPGATQDDMSAGAYNLEVQLAGAPPPVTIPMTPSVSGLVYGAAVGSTGPFGALVAGSTQGQVNQAATASSGPVAAVLTAGSSGQPSLASSIASATAGTNPNTLLGWVEANTMWIILLVGAAIVLPPLIRKL